MDPTTTDTCRICLDILSKKQRRTIFSTTFNVSQQLHEVLGYVPRNLDGGSVYICFKCFNKLNKLSKIDFDLNTRLETLKNDKNKIIAEMRSGLVSNRQQVQQPSDSVTQVSTCAQQTSTVPLAMSTPMKSKKRLVTHTPTPRKVKRVLISTPVRKKLPQQIWPKPGETPTNTCVSSTARKRLGDKLLSPNKAKVSFHYNML